MNHRIPAGGARSTLQDGIAHSHFSVQTEPPQRRLLAWRERVGHVNGVLHSSSDLEKPFSAPIDRYELGGLVFTDCRSDAMSLDRSLVRISRDGVRNFAFHVFLDVGVQDVRVRSLSRMAGAPLAAKVLALDLGQPVRMWRNGCRVLTLFVRRRGASRCTHGRAASCRSLRQAGAAARGGRYIQANLHRGDLSPEAVIAALRLPRPTLTACSSMKAAWLPTSGI